MSIKQTLKKSKSKTNHEIELCISSSKVVSATTPVISKEVEHAEIVLRIGGFDATNKKNVSKFRTNVVHIQSTVTKIG